MMIDNTMYNHCDVKFLKLARQKNPCLLELQSLSFWGKQRHNLCPPFYQIQLTNSISNVSRIIYSKQKEDRVELSSFTSKNVTSPTWRMWSNLICKLLLFFFHEVVFSTVHATSPLLQSETVGVHRLIVTETQIYPIHDEWLAGWHPWCHMSHHPHNVYLDYWILQTVIITKYTT